MFSIALSSHSAFVFHPCSVMGRGKQWSVDTVRPTASYRSADGRRAADAAQLQCPCEERLHGRQARQSPWCAREADRRDEALDL